MFNRHHFWMDLSHIFNRHHFWIGSSHTFTINSTANHNHDILYICVPNQIYNRHDIAEILLKVVLSTKNQSINQPTCNVVLVGLVTTFELVRPTHLLLYWFATHIQRTPLLNGSLPHIQWSPLLNVRVKNLICARSDKVCSNRPQCENFIT
jgi:hypothetical protein